MAGIMRTSGQNLFAVDLILKIVLVKIIFHRKSVGLPALIFYRAVEQMFESNQGFCSTTRSFIIDAFSDIYNAQPK